MDRVSGASNTGTPTRTYQLVHNFSLQVFNFFGARLRTLFAKREALTKARSEGRTGEEQFAEEGKSTEER
jgi:hypothetical protein